MSSEIKNAIIKGARITTADHGVLTIWLDLDYGGSGQGFGGHALYLPKNWRHHEKNSNYAGHFIWRVMEIAGVLEWSNIVGKTIRVQGDNSGITAIGHIVKTDWFNPTKEFKEIPC